MIVVLFFMVLMHIIEDFHLQGIMGNMKTKSWWDELFQNVYAKTDNPEQAKWVKEYQKKAKFDYVPVLLLHGFEWSMFIHMPVLAVYWFTQGVVLFDSTFMYVLCAVIIIQGLIHSMVDDIKANGLGISLVTDQSIHLIQILVSYLILVGF